MKSINRIIFFLLWSSLFFACKKQGLPAKPQPSPFSVSAQSSDSISSSGGNVVVNISGLTDGWWIVIPDEDKSWCSCSRIYGSGNATISFTFKANTTGTARSVEVQFNPTFNLSSQSLTFSQQ